MVNPTPRKRLKELIQQMATKNPKIPENLEYLAFAGGGATAFAELGFFNALHDKGKAEKLKGIAGTSAGSMMAGLIALGYRGEELVPLTVQQDFGSFTSMQDTTEIINALPNMLSRKSGIFTGSKIRGWMEHAIAKRTGKPDMSFAELHQWRKEAEESLKTGDLTFFYHAARTAFTREENLGRRYQRYANNGPFRLDFDSAEELRENVLRMTDYHVIASEVQEVEGVTHYSQALFSHTNPELADTPIARAVEASASFPFVFAREEINGKLYSDGGLTNNIPLEVFDAIDGKPNPNAMAIAVNYVPNENRHADNPQLAMFQKVVKIRNQLPFLRDWEIDETQTVFEDRLQDEADKLQDAVRTVMINVKGVDYTDFGITPEEKEAAIQAGYDKAEQVIQANESQKDSWVESVSSKPRGFELGH